VRALIVHPGDGRAIRPRSALAAARALAAAGWTVGIGSPGRDFVSASRASHRWHRVRSSWESVEGFIEETRAAVIAGGYEVVFGSNDSDVLALSSHRAEVGASVPHPPHERVLRALDKLHLASAARRVGLETPRIPSDYSMGREVVVKPRVCQSTPQEAMVFSNLGQAASRIAEVAEAGGEPVVQERVRGQLMAYVVVADRESRVVARVQQEARTIWPLNAGMSARAETVSVDEALAEKVAKLVQELGWFGLAQLQFVVPENGVPVLIDFNGRLYGSIALAVAAGVNLPAIWGCVATDRPLPPTREALAGVRYQWEEGDFRRARAERRGGLARDVGGSIHYFQEAAHSIWSADDPVPALRVLQSLIAGSLRFRLGAARRQLSSTRSNQRSVDRPDGRPQPAPRMGPGRTEVPSQTGRR
jgi:predicted ATP-grasp superfamily ATP-dependent carboligase